MVGSGEGHTAAGGHIEVVKAVEQIVAANLAHLMPDIDVLSTKSSLWPKTAIRADPDATGLPPPP